MIIEIRLVKLRPVAPVPCLTPGTRCRGSTQRIPGGAQALQLAGLNSGIVPAGQVLVEVRAGKRLTSVKKV